MLLKIQHTTRYRFDEPVHYALQQVRKTPKSGAQQTVRSWAVSVTGGRKEASFRDHHNNTVELISLTRDTMEVEITCEGEVQVAESHGVVGRHTGPAPLWLYNQATPRTAAGPGVQRIAAGFDATGGVEVLHDLSAAIRDSVAYQVGASAPDWSAEDAISAAQGVCQDHTHVFIACARHLGIPARYVSGYLMLNDRTMQDAMHAWAEAHVDGLGWVGFDVSNGISPDQRYVRVATGLDYSDAAPISGTRIGGAAEELAVHIDVAQQ